jgi:hypothetical protein
MEYAIGADAEFLRVLVQGRDTDVPPSALCAQVFAESERLERPRILIELDQKIPLSLASQQQLIEALPKIGEGWYGRPPTAPASHRRSNASRGSGLLQR